MVRASVACGPLLQWLVSQVSYSEILAKVAPLRSEVESLEAEGAGLADRFAAAAAEAAALEGTISQLKLDYAASIAEREAIKVPCGACLSPPPPLLSPVRAGGRTGRRRGRRATGPE